MLVTSINTPKIIPFAITEKLSQVNRVVIFIDFYSFIVWFH